MRHPVDGQDEQDPAPPAGPAGVPWQALDGDRDEVGDAAHWITTFRGSTSCVTADRAPARLPAV